MLTSTDISLLADRLASGKRPHEWMREDEADAGYEIIIPGTVSWFPLSEWAPTCVISRDRHFIRLVMLDALRPHTGAFKRALAAIKTARLVPLVVAPIGAAMPAILTHYGWQCKRIWRSPCDSYEIWGEP